MTSDSRPPARKSRLPLIGLIVAVAVGLVGAGIGAWCAARARREGTRAPRLAVAAIVVGVLQTVALAIALPVVLSGPSGTPDGTTPIPSRTYPSWAPPSEPSLDTPSPVRPLPTSLQSYTVPTVGIFQATDSSRDTGTIEKGATSATTITYASSNSTVRTLTAVWPTADAADAYVEAEARTRFGTQPAELTAPIPSGTMSLYIQNDQGTIFSRQGNITMVITGGQTAVQEFFSQFPA